MKKRIIFFIMVALSTFVSTTVRAENQHAYETLKNELLVLVPLQALQLDLVLGICDDIKDPYIGEMTLGTISKSFETGVLKKPLPAMIVSIGGTCINTKKATKEKKILRWVLSAMDEEFNVERCYHSVMHKEDLYRQNAVSDCDFKPL